MLECKTIEKIMDEYNVTDKNQGVYYFFGLCVYKAQCLEDTLMIYVSILHVILRNEPIDRIDKYYDRFSDYTLGKLIFALKRLDNDCFRKHKENLQKALDLRNKIVHGFLLRNISRLDTDKIDDLLLELEFLSRKLEEANSLLTYDLLKFMEEKYPSFSDVLKRTRA